MAGGRGLVIVGPDVMPSAFYDSPVPVRDPEASESAPPVRPANSGDAVLVATASKGHKGWQKIRGMLETVGGGEGGVLGKEWSIHWPAENWEQLKAAAEAGGWSIAGLGSSQQGQVQGFEAEDEEEGDYGVDTGVGDYGGHGKGAAGSGEGELAVEGAGVTLQQQRRRRRGRSLAQTTRPKRQTNAAAPQFDAATIPVGAVAPYGGSEWGKLGTVAA